MRIERTQRGFAIAEFQDYNEQKCSLQKSSIATDDLIWLGVDDADPVIFVAGQGWQPCPLPDGVLLHTRMHLTREQVKALLPLLKRFVKTGELE